MTKAAISTPSSARPKWPAISTGSARVATALVLAAFASRAYAQTPAETLEILAAILAQEATYERGSLTTCVMPETEGDAFDQQRALAQSLRGLKGRPDLLQAMLRPQFPWSSVRIPRGEHPRPTPRADPRLSARLDAAAQRLLASAAGPRHPIAIPALPARLRPFGGESGCPARLTLSAPAVDGDLAFVATGYVCGGLCGNGWLYALRREGGHWHVAAIVFTWVS